MISRRIWHLDCGGATYHAVASDEEECLKVLSEAEPGMAKEWAVFTDELPECRLATFEEACHSLTNAEDLPELHPTLLGQWLDDQSPRILSCSEWP